jgi:hypothetical protein
MLGPESHRDWRKTIESGFGKDPIAIARINPAGFGGKSCEEKSGNAMCFAQCLACEPAWRYFRPLQQVLPPGIASLLPCPSGGVFGPEGWQELECS